MEIIQSDSYDAADKLFRRGDFLRKLRELERQDEEQRALNDDNELSGSRSDDTLNYESYLASQSYYDDYKHVNYRFIDFGMVADRPLIVEQDRTVGKGGFVWDAGFILAEHLLSANELQTDTPKKIIELGAGTGITGLMVARSMPRSSIHLTDLPQLQPLFQKNARTSPNVTTGILEWGKGTSEKYDVIIGADVVASIYDSTGLSQTLYGLATKDTRVYLACRDRLAGSIERFEGQMKQLFTQVERRKAYSSNKNPDVWIFYASGRKCDQ